MKNYTGEDDYRIRTNPMSMGEYLGELKRATLTGLDYITPEIPEHDMKMSDEGNYEGDIMPLRDYLDTTMPFTPAGDAYEVGSLAADWGDLSTGEKITRAALVAIPGTFVPIDKLKKGSSYTQAADDALDLADKKVPLPEQLKQTGAFAPIEGGGDFQTPQNRGYVEIFDDVNAFDIKKLSALPLDKSTKLMDIYDDRALYDAVPGAENIAIKKTKLPTGVGASFDSTQNVILLPDDIENSWKAMDSSGKISFYHELMHAVQQATEMNTGENFTKGVLNQSFFDLVDSLDDLELSGSISQNDAKSYLKKLELYWDQFDIDPRVLGFDPYRPLSKRIPNTKKRATYQDTIFTNALQSSDPRMNNWNPNLPWDQQPPEVRSVYLEAVPYFHSEGESVADVSSSRAGRKPKWTRGYYPFGSPEKPAGSESWVIDHPLDSSYGVFEEVATLNKPKGTYRLDSLPVTNDPNGKILRADVLSIRDLIEQLNGTKPSWRK